MAMRFLAGLGGAVYFLIALQFVSMAREATTVPAYLYVDGMKLIINMVFFALFALIGIILVVWACTPRRT